VGLVGSVTLATGVLGFTGDNLGFLGNGDVGNLTQAFFGIGTG